MKQEDNWKKRFEDKFIVVWTNNGGETEMQRTLCAKGSEDFEDFIRSEKQKSFNSALEEIEKIIDKMAKDYVLTLEERKLADKIGSLDICEADERAYLKALDDVKKLLKLKQK